MPYIKQEERDQIDPKLKEMLDHMGVLTPGQFVYMMYQICQWQTSFGGTGDLPVGWGSASRVLADLEATKLEFYRRVVAPYEDQKIQENGDCEPLRANSEPYNYYGARGVNVK